MGNLTVKNSINNLNQIVNDINSSNGAYYFFVGGTVPWANDASPPAPNNAFNEFEQSIYHAMDFGKLITNNNIGYLIPRINWTNNTIYNPYDYQNPNLIGNNFYVVTSNYSVFKCMDNNANSASIIQPSLQTTSGSFKTSDGYVWKYMYTIPNLSNTLFTTNTYIPVVANTFVSNGAIPGTIDVVRVPTRGTNYQGYNIGYVNTLVSPTSVKLANTASLISGFYVGSSIYLTSGLGSDQIRLITAYNGPSQVATVSNAFNQYVNLYLNNNYTLTGSFLLGDSVSQNVSTLSYVYSQGSFNVGDSMIQTDTGVSGTVLAVNSTVMQVLYTTLFTPGLTIYDNTDGFILKAGLVSSTNGSSNVNVVSGANLQSIYVVNNYISVGNSTVFNVRRVSSVTNSSQLIVNTPFTKTLVANTHYLVPDAFDPVTFAYANAYGVVIETNLTSIEIAYNNVSSSSINFIPGETVKEFDAFGVDQNANATISYANSTTLILSNVNGVLTSSLFLVGQSSSLKAQITNIILYPNITLGNVLGTFQSGLTVVDNYANGTLSGQGQVLYSTVSPSSTTQYIVSPTVNLNGDGQGFTAYAVVNTTPGSAYEITGIIPVTTGNSYTNATAYISANAQWGNGAIIYPVISPVKGHGSDPVTELGAKLLGISLTIDVAANESYKFPNYGSYRRTGIIKNPVFNDLYVTLGTPQRANLNIQTLSGAFVNNEIIYQYSSAAAGKIQTVNTTFIQIDSINGTFVSNASNSSSNNLIVGLTSNATANVMTSNLINFSISSNTQIIYQTNGFANGLLTQVVNSSLIRLTNINGKFANGTIIYDPTINAYANAVALYTANDTINSSGVFGLRFNNMARLTLSSNSLTPFVVGEKINQAVSNASGLLVDSTHELDISYNLTGGTLSIGTSITDSNTGANGIITFSNSTYLRLTGVNGVFSNANILTNITGNGTINYTLPVLVVGDCSINPFQTGGSYTLTGLTSGAIGIMGISNTIVYPDLVRNSGQVIYCNDVTPFTVNLSTKETFNIIMSF